MTICVDASVIAKLVLPEIDQGLAISLVLDAGARSEPMIRPPHTFVEVSSAIYKRCQAGSLSPAHARIALTDLETLPIISSSPGRLYARACEIATQFRFKWIYDAFYVALAEIVGCDLWTADEKLHESVSGAFPNVRLLTHYQQASP